MSNRGAMITGSVGIKCGSESDLQSAVANVGPISVVVDSNSNTFRVRQLNNLYNYYNNYYYNNFFMRT